MGLILSSLLFMSMLKQEGIQTTPIQTKPLSLEEVKTEAAHYGYQLSKASPKPPAQKIEKTFSIPFTIEKGLSNNQIADLLYQKKIIIEKEQFLKIIQKYNLVKEIRAGNYSYSSIMTIEDLIAMITNTQKENWKKI